MTLSVLASAAIATAVLAGAVIVGDSLRSSLRRLVVDRLGGIDWSLRVPEPFRVALADDVAKRVEAADAVAAPAFLLSGSAIQPDSGRLAGDVRLLGIDARFGAFYGDEGERLAAAVAPRPGQLFPAVAVNRSLARELGLAEGDPILLNVRQITDIPRESLLGNQPTLRELAGLRGTVSAILPDRGPGRFDLEAHQARPRNAFVALPVLERRLGYPERANTLLLGDGNPAPSVPQAAVAVAEALTLDDLGLRVDGTDGLLRLSNRRFVLRDSTVEAARRAARRNGLEAQTVLGSLANQMRRGDRMVPYSVVLGLEMPSTGSLGTLESLEGDPIASLADSEVILGAWTARELDAHTGDEIELTYFAVGEDDALEERATRLRVAAIAAMRGLMVDSTVLPPFPGIAEADDMAAWQPPFPMDLGLIRPQDEEFWDRYRAAPKAIVSLATAQRLWRSRFGKATVVRVAAGEGQRRAFLDSLGAELDPAAFGFAPQPVKRRGLEAATGATDFAGLFLGFSFFLIAAAALVVALLFSLSVELRAKEIGLRRALGFPLASVRRLLLGEGTLLALLGGALGTALAVAYAAVLIRFIAGLWSEQIDLPLLALSLEPVHLLIALAAAVAVVALTIAVSLRRLRRLSIPALLAADLARERRHRGGRWARRVAVASAVLLAGTLAAALLAGRGSSPAYFFAAGALAVVAGLGGFAWWNARSRGGIGGAGRGAFLRMAAHNGAFNPRRSLLSVSLVCCATFLLVAVAANRRELDPSDLGRDSGTGGFTVVAESSIPLRGPLGDAGVERELGLGDDTAGLLATIPTFSLRLRPGEDVSCLNLYQPRRPRIVGVPPAFVTRGGFRFGALTHSVDNPWSLLDEDLGPGIVPAIGDANSVLWILHSGLGQDVEMVDDRGEPVRLRLVGLLQKSIFQSELLIAEDAFVEHFPQHGGYSYFLAEAPPLRTEELLRALETGLEGHGFDATTTVAKLARFLGIEEMYLSTFQLLGGLGLVLGTLGLGVVLVRNVNERRGELAMLRAVGFRRGAIAWVVGLETAFHLVIGLVIGTVAGLVALTPYLLDASLRLPWVALAATLATVLSAGLIATALGVVVALRAPLLVALKAE